MISPALRSLLSAGRAVFGATVDDLRNPPWESAERRILVVRLSPFRDVDRSSAHLILFAEARKALPDAFIDFAFFPDRQDRELLGRGWGRGQAEYSPVLPWFFGASSGTSPAVFDLILVSNAFGLELITLPRLLSTSGLPLRASARASSERELPILILGGSNAGQCSALVDETGDSLVDGIFLGEGEGAIGELALLLSDRGRSRRARLEAASGITGFWPALHPEKKTKRRILADSPPPLLDWPLFDTPEAGTTRLQITAGCPGYCSFCFEGWDRRPYRELPFEAVLEAAREIRARNGADTLELYSFNFNTHEEIINLLYELGRIFRNVNFMSQRLDILARTPGLMAAELAADKRSFTLGIEGVSARMRAFYRKGLDDEDLEKLLSLLVAPGVRELKLFYIVSGLENEADIAEFSTFAEELDRRRKTFAPGLRVLVSAGYLVRLPGTPLRHAPLALDEGLLSRIAAGLGEACERYGLEWRLAVHFDEYCIDQLLSLAGGGLLPWLEGLAFQGPNEVYDGSPPRSVWKSLEAFARERGILDEAFLGEKGEEAAPVFPIIDEGSSGAALWREYQKAKDCIDRESCLGGRCADCGACEEPATRVFMTRHRAPKIEGRDIDRLTRLLAAKRGFETKSIGLTRPAELAGASAPAQEAWLLARLAASAPAAWKRVFTAKLRFPLPEDDFGLPEGAWGRAVFDIQGPRAEALAELARAAGFEPLSAPPRPARLTLDLGFDNRFHEAAVLLGLSDGDGQKGLDPSSLLASWLAASHLAATEHHGPATRRFVIAERDLGKRIAYRAEAGPSAIALELGPKARLAELFSPLGARLTSLVSVRVEGWS